MCVKNSKESEQYHSHLKGLQMPWPIFFSLDDLYWSSDLEEPCLMASPCCDTAQILLSLQHTHTEIIYHLSNNNHHMLNLKIPKVGTNGHRSYLHLASGVGLMAIVVQLDVQTSMDSMMQDPSLSRNVCLRDNCHLSNPGLV